MKYLLSFTLLLTAVFAFAETPSATRTPVGKGLSDCVVVIGQARAAQAFPYTADLTIMQAVLLSGGISEFGTTPIYLIRNGAVKHKTSSRLIDKAPKTEDLTLLPWDIICIGTIVTR